MPDIRAILKLTAVLGTFCFSTGCNAQTSQTPQTSNIPAGYKLVWSDEFNGDGLPDDKKWTYDQSGNRFLQYHNEREYYTKKKAENTLVKDGLLNIVTRKDDLTGYPDWMGQEYSSGKLTTQFHQTWKYGFFDIRAKMPCGRGIWPSLWLLSDTGRWPNDGEIDIMESVGFEVPSKVHSTLHNALEGKVPSEHGAVVIEDICKTFHNYQMDWRDGSITFMIDGQIILHKERGNLGYMYWPYDHKFYFLMNVAVGGAWGNQKGIDPAIFPTTMQVDYVRVYQAK